ERRREHEIQRGNFPSLLRAAGIHRDGERLEQVLGRIVIAVRVLDAWEDGEFAPRPHVDLELRHAVDEVIVHALRILPVAVAARLPVAFEDVPGVTRERTEELRGGGAAGGHEPRREYTNIEPVAPGKPRTHDASLSRRAVESPAEYTNCAP